MLFLTKQTDLYASPAGIGGEVVGRSQPGEPVRVLDCIAPQDAQPPGYIDIFHSKERLQWFYENTMDLVQVGHPPAVGFALVPRKHISDVPF